MKDTDEQTVTQVEAKQVDSSDSIPITTTNPIPETIGFETESEEISITACNSEIESSAQSTEDNLDSSAKVNEPAEISNDQIVPHIEICEAEESKMEVEVDNTSTTEAVITQDNADDTTEQNEVITVVEPNPTAEEDRQTVENDSQATEATEPDVTPIIDHPSVSDRNDSKEDVAIAALMSLGRSDVSTTEYFYESKAEEDAEILSSESSGSPVNPTEDPVSETQTSSDHQDNSEELNSKDIVEPEIEPKCNVDNLVVLVETESFPEEGQLSHDDQDEMEVENVDVINNDNISIIKPVKLTCDGIEDISSDEGSALDTEPISPPPDAISGPIIPLVPGGLSSNKDIAGPSPYRYSALTFPMSTQTLTELRSVNITETASYSITTQLSEHTKPSQDTAVEKALDSPKKADKEDN